MALGTATALGIAAIPPLIGAAANYWGSSKPAQITNIPTQSEGQIGDQDFLRGLARQGLQNPEQGFQPIADQARKQFRNVTAPSIAQRFASLGATRSSAFPGAIESAASDLEGNLAAQQAQFGIQNRNSLANMMQMGLGQQFDTHFQPERLGTAQTIGQGAIGQGISGFNQVLGASMQSDSIKEWQDYMQGQKEGQGNQQQSNSQNIDPTFMNALASLIQHMTPGRGQ